METHRHYILAVQSKITELLLVSAACSRKLYLANIPHIIMGFVSTVSS